MKLVCIVQSFNSPALGVIARQGEEREFPDELANKLLDEGGWLRIPGPSGDGQESAGEDRESEEQKEAKKEAKKVTNKPSTRGKRRKSTRKKVSMEEAMDPNQTTIKVGKK